MFSSSLQNADLESFRKANTLLNNPAQNYFGPSFEETLENQAKEAVRKTKDQTNEITDNTTDTKKKKSKENSHEGLPDITQIMRNTDRGNPHGAKNTYLLLEKFKEKKKIQDEDFNNNQRQQLLNNANFAGQAMVQPVYDQGQRKASKSQMLAAWEKFAPVVTEDATKKAVRLDIPLLNDIQAVVLRMHPDRSVTASLLCSYEMGELVKQSKDRLDRNLRHHHLSLREFNTYHSELDLNSESGTSKKKKQAKPSGKKTELDLI